MRHIEVITDTDALVCHLQGYTVYFPGGPYTNLHSIMHSAELRCGSSKAHSKALEAALDALDAIEDDYEIAQITPQTIIIHADIIKQMARRRRAIGVYDAWLAAQAIELNIAIATRWPKAFAGIKGLRVVKVRIE